MLRPARASSMRRRRYSGAYGGCVRGMGNLLFYFSPNTVHQSGSTPQQRLRDQGVRSGEGRKTEALGSPLSGKLFDESGEPLYVQGAAKGQRRYRYYVSRALVRGDSEGTEQGWRISAPEIEQRVAAPAQAVLGDRLAIALALDT